MMLYIMSGFQFSNVYYVIIILYMHEYICKFIVVLIFYSTIFSHLNKQTHKTKNVIHVYVVFYVFILWMIYLSNSLQSQRDI